MYEGRFASGAALRRWIVGFSVGTALPALPWVVIYCASLVRFDTRQLLVLIGLVAVAVMIAGGIGFLIARALTPQLAVYVDRTRSEGAPFDALPSSLVGGAFRDVMALPPRLFVCVWLNWTACGTAVALVMGLLDEGFTTFARSTVAVAGVSGGLITQILAYVLFKERLTPLREELVAKLVDPGQRESLVARVPIASKLYVSVVGIVLTSVLFAVSMAQVRTTARDDAEWLGLGEAFLDRVETRVQEGETFGDLRRDLEAWLPDALLELTRIDPWATEADARALGLTESELAEVLASPGRGASTDMITTRRFLWRALPGDGGIALLHAHRTHSQGSVARVLTDYGVFVLLALSVAFGLAYLIGRDLARMSRALGQEVRAVAEGRLDRHWVFESEDELGDLARGVDEMASSLRQTVGHIAGTVASVDAAAGQIRGASGDLAFVTREQVEGIEQVGLFMQNILEQARGITSSIDTLLAHVEGQGSAIQQIGSTSESLATTSVDLSQQVAGVTTSIEQMRASIGSVAALVEGLSDSASDTTANMEEMAASIRQIDNNAGLTVKLAERMLEDADRGRDAVDQTTAEMREIRGGTDTVEAVVGNLVGHSQEIGAILEVIEGVADETNLLALNAAIIAAQAGDRGHGFKVVADQVKQLARRVLASTGEIGALIASVQTETRNAVTAIATSSARVDQGVARSEEATGKLETITGSAGECGGRIRQIVEGVGEHSRAVGDVIERMESVNESAQQIRRMGLEQREASELVSRSSAAMDTIASQVREGTREQTEALRFIRQGIIEVEGTARKITRSVLHQEEDCEGAVRFLSQVQARTEANEGTVREMDEAIQGLADQAAALREHLKRFRT